MVLDFLSLVLFFFFQVSLIGIANLNLTLKMFKSSFFDFSNFRTKFKKNMRNLLQRGKKIDLKQISIHFLSFFVNIQNKFKPSTS